MEIRRDEVYSRILQEMSTMDNFIQRKINVVYHRNCYKKYTSKQNCSFQNRSDKVSRCDKLLSEQNRHNSTREPVYHHFDLMRTPSTCSHAHRMQFYVL
jgi:hypothetical protein